jgi:hypothetical protein
MLDENRQAPACQHGYDRPVPLRVRHFPAGKSIDGPGSAAAGYDVEHRANELTRKINFALADELAKPVLEIGFIDCLGAAMFCPGNRFKVQKAVEFIA